VVQTLEDPPDHAYLIGGRVRGRIACAQDDVGHDELALNGADVAEGLGSNGCWYVRTVPIRPGLWPGLLGM